MSTPIVYAPAPVAAPSKLTKICSSVKKFWSTFKWILLVVVAFAAFALFSMMNTKKSKIPNKSELNHVQSLLSYAAKSAQEAESVQNTDPLQALLHANYAVCYLNASKHMIDDDNVNKILDNNLQQFESNLSNLQQKQIETIYTHSRRSI